VTGVRVLLAVAVRRDRVRLAVWIVALAGIMAGSAASTARLYPTHASLETLARGLQGTPATLALYGPPAQLGTVGGVAMWKPGGIGLVLAGLLGLLTVVRHTRAEEEVGLTELTGAGGVGRLAPLASSLVLSTLVAVGLGLLVTLGLVATASGGGGAIGAGLSFAAMVFVFSGVAAVAAQVAVTGRAANGLGGAVLGASYLIRAVADGSSRLSWLSWLSPIGWVQRLEPYAASPRWWVLALPLLTGLALVAIAAVLRSRRDLGAALLASRPGPAVGGARLAGPFGLAWRLQRGPFVAWAIGFAGLGGLLGWLAAQIGSLVDQGSGTADLLAKLGGRSNLVDSYLGAAFGFGAIAASAYAVLVVLRLRTEEEAGRVEPLLAGSVSRGRLLGAQLVLALGGAVALLAILGLVAGLAHGLDPGAGTSVGAQVPRLVLAALAQAPAAWLLAALAVLLVGAIPLHAVLSWAVLGVAVVLGPLGAVIGLPGWAQDISPYAQIPHLPAPSVPAGDLVPLAVLTALAVVALAAGVASYRRRDIPA
jgi:ABC-2 type transport system permease protein